MSENFSSALKFVKTTVGNQQAFLGKTYASRAVSFNLDDNHSAKSGHTTESRSSDTSAKDIRRLLEQVQSLSKKLDQIGSTDNSRASSPARSALSSRTSSPARSLKCFTCGSSDHLNRECPDRMSQQDSPGRANMCFFCKKPGHFADNCPERRSRSRSPSPGRNSSRDASPSYKPKY